MLLFAMVMAITSRKAVFALAFLGVGAALGIAYTSAMYHGLSARRKRGRNSGIHEALVSAASITGCLFGGILAQLFTTRAPFVLFGVLVGLGLVATAVVRCTVADPAEPVTEPRADAGR
jgi:MFS family permease